VNGAIVTAEPKSAVGKFQNPDWTARGEARARVKLESLDTLWINTGTLCNITCQNCYIGSSPRNDRLSYITRAEARRFLDEIQQLDLGTREIGFTGGEPFLNPDCTGMIEDALSLGFRVLVLTNAMQPMQRPKVKARLLDLSKRFANKLTIRVSLDHYSPPLHDAERGPGSFKRTTLGIDWLASKGVSIAIAGRTCWGESEAETRPGYAALIAQRQWPIDSTNPDQLVLFPELDEHADIPEITTECWGLLGKRPGEMMCASSRMVVKRKGEDRPVVLPCTLLPYDPRFEMGATLAQSLSRDGGMFDEGAVKLCHPHCAKFCVLGGGSCAAR